MPRTRPDEPTLYAELIRRGLPADYARRTAEEIDDHRADLLADLHHDEAIDERLGEPRALARKIARDYRRRTWIGRWPVASFALLPIVALFACWIALALLIDLAPIPYLETLREWATSWPAEAKAAWCMGFHSLFFMAIPMGIAWSFARSGAYRGVPIGWALASCLLLGLISGAFMYDLRVSYEPGMSSYRVGLPVLTATGPLHAIRYYLFPQTFAQLAAPVLMGFWVMASERRRRAALFALPTAYEPMRAAA